ncbi:MAG: hypothetical protein V4813_10640 [Gemmatimonadota bacterium]
MTAVGQNPREVAAAQAAQARGDAQAAAQQARNEAEQARDIARAQREAAQAQRDAARAEREAREESQQGDGGTGVVTITKDGVTTVLNGASPEAVTAALGYPDLRHGGGGDDEAGYVVAGLGIVSTALVMIVALVLRYRGKSRSMGKAPELSADLTQRLSRMEAGIESVAVEVERISEGQRFTTRLLADRPVEEVRRG